jgi:hypothetical protein
VGLVAVAMGVVTVVVSSMQGEPSPRQAHAGPPAVADRAETSATAPSPEIDRPEDRGAPAAPGGAPPSTGDDPGDGEAPETEPGAPRALPGPESSSRASVEASSSAPSTSPSEPSSSRSSPRSSSEASAADPEPRPRAAPGRRRREPIETGAVNVVTPGGWADVYFGRRHLGRTPRRFTLPVGRQVLRLLPRGRPPAVRLVVRVTPGSTARYAVDLDR